MCNHWKQKVRISENYRKLMFTKLEQPSQVAKMVLGLTMYYSIIYIKVPFILLITHQKIEYPFTWCHFFWIPVMLRSSESLWVLLDFVFLLLPSTKVCFSALMVLWVSCLVTHLKKSHWTQLIQMWFQLLFHHN